MSPPSKQDEGKHVKENVHEEIKAHWMELFFDLIYVAVIVHLSSEVVNSIDKREQSGHRRLAGGTMLPNMCPDEWIYAFIVTCMYKLQHFAVLHVM